MTLEHFYRSPDSIEVYTDVPEPATPWRERTHFSGGVNLSAIERNRQALDNYELARLRVFVLHGALHCCPSAWETLQEALLKQGKSPVQL